MNTLFFKTIYSSLALCLVFAQIARAEGAGAAPETIVDLEPRTVFIPNGFDDNDDVVAVVDGYLPDTCHQLRSAFVEVNEAARKIVIQPRMVDFTSSSVACMDVTIPYTSVVHLGVLSPGQYQITKRNGTAIQNLDVKRAGNQGPDDFLYASVDGLQVTANGGKAEVRLYGRHTNTCLTIEDVKVIPSLEGKTIALLPVMGRKPGTTARTVCETKEVPYEKVVKLPELVQNERYLLHVRSSNGQSVNQVFTQY